MTKQTAPADMPGWTVELDGRKVLIRNEHGIRTDAWVLSNRRKALAWFRKLAKRS